MGINRPESPSGGRYERAEMTITAHPAWQALEAHYHVIRDRHLRELFAEDPRRGERMTAEATGIYLDYSKNRITDETLKLLLRLGGGGRSARPDRRDVPRRQDQRHRKPRRAARGVARPEGRDDPGRWRERGAGGARRPRQDGRASPTASAAAIGRGTPASASATSSTSASAAPISGR